MASLALSADGSTAVVGGPYDTSAGQYTGAVWAYVRTNGTSSHDMNGDGLSDVLWRDSGGDVVHESLV